MKWQAIVIHPSDDVATALTELKAGARVQVEVMGRLLEVTLRDDIAFGHKFALHDMNPGDQILKYGMPILKAQQPIGAGEWVHTHNGRSDRWGPQNEDSVILMAPTGPQEEPA
jgi:hypothetical protein